MADGRSKFMTNGDEDNGTPLYNLEHKYKPITKLITVYEHFVLSTKGRSHWCAILAEFVEQ